MSGLSAIQSAGTSCPDIMPNYYIRKASAWFLPDRYYAKLAFIKHHGRFPRTPPVTFSEKICDLIGSGKLEKYRAYADKLEVRDFVGRKVGPKYLVPLYGTAEQLTANLWDSLPEAFILKPNHGSAWSRFVWNKSAASFDAVAAVAATWLKKDYYFIRRERQYRNIKPCLLFEKILTGDGGEIPEDYKFFCFHGKVRFVQVTLRKSFKRRLFYNLDWTKLRIRHQVPNFGKIARPAALEEMRSIAEALAEGFDFVRVDLYSVREGVFFGELTLTPTAGADCFDPPDFDEYLGGLWTGAYRTSAPDLAHWREDASAAEP